MSAKVRAAGMHPDGNSAAVLCIDKQGEMFYQEAKSRLQLCHAESGHHEDQLQVRLALYCCFCSHSKMKYR
jgi:hypothetical protein